MKTLKYNTESHGAIITFHRCRLRHKPLPVYQPPGFTGSSCVSRDDAARFLRNARAAGAIVSRMAT